VQIVWQSLTSDWLDHQHWFFCFSLPSKCFELCSSVVWAHVNYTLPPHQPWINMILPSLS